MDNISIIRWCTVPIGFSIINHYKPLYIYKSIYFGGTPMYRWMVWGYHHDSGNLQMSGVISLRQDAGLIHPFLEENHLSVPLSWVVPRTMDFHGFPIQNLQFLWFRYPPQICSDTSSGGLYLPGSRELFGGCGCQLSDQENASFVGRCDGYNWCIKGKHGKILNIK